MAAEKINHTIPQNRYNHPFPHWEGAGVRSPNPTNSIDPTNTTDSTNSNCGKIIPAIKGSDVRGPLHRHRGKIYICQL